VLALYVQSLEFKPQSQPKKRKETILFVYYCVSRAPYKYVNMTRKMNENKVVM
jgi:hypothetical protein